ncbi:transglycosylase SLT domain-containing protein [Halopseudomonas phragmitis]|uniref:Lytic murein transglycosylase n=1 Tax=Halopseudomonas phragmitis TaxID=1931241 RepID=A0A1V0B6K2_9GAMM|nr:transglycosylase SLT domain-containing protein [Halopseudomonas phragmitis]AQZ95547.1 lytic murein transglycosylase [Halopseudomonas phragmitis]
MNWTERIRPALDRLPLLVWLSLIIVTLSGLGCEPAAAQDVPRAAEQYRRDLVRVAQWQFGLGAPVATLAGQIHQESAWRHSAVSPAGAQGLAQFMPATGRWMAEIYPRRLGPADPFNPGWALRAMVTYNQWHLDRIQAHTHCEKWAMALAAYNGGLGWINRDKRLASASGADPLTWFDSVERFNAGRSAANFRENRDYPRRILERWEPMYVRAGWGRGVCGERYEL